MTAEFTLKLPLAKITNHAQPVRIEATDVALKAVAERFGLASLGRLVADLEVSRAGKGALVRGRFEADAVQSCIISGEPLPVTVADDIELRFEPDATAPGQEVELEEEALDVIPIDGDSIDLAEAVAQSLLLALDPYPRASEEVLARARHHIISEEDAAGAEATLKAENNPFAKLRPK